VNVAPNAAPASDSYTIPQFTSAALVTIDTQRDVLDDGAFPIPGTSAVLPAMRRLVEGFREAQRPIVHIVRIYEQDGSNAEPCRRRLLADGAQLVIRGTPGCQLASELLPEPALQLDEMLLLNGGVQLLGASEVAIYKPRWGAFYRTPLEHHLRRQAVSTVVFAGCNFPNCPRISIYQASERDFRVVAVRDAISGLYERGEQELANIGVQLMGSVAVTDALSAAKSPTTSSAATTSHTRSRAHHQTPHRSDRSARTHRHVAARSGSPNGRFLSGGQDEHRDPRL
jgi:nicotinamidase-related amidase